MVYSVVCTKCGSENSDAAFRCHKCNSILEVRYAYSPLPKLRKNGTGMSKYLNMLPVVRLFSLGEGTTPLKRIGQSSRGSLLLKVETGNPTCTFKDRGSAVEISKAMELGMDSVVCASTGNMGLSVAYYARHAGIKCTIFISRDANRRKIKKILAQKAAVKEVKGDFNTALNAAERFSRKTGAFVCGDYHYRKEGQKTVAFEVMEQLRYRAPDYVFMPAGNATLFSGFYKGLKEFKILGLIDKMPRLIAVQSEMCDPLVKAIASGKRITYTRPKTAADAIAVGYPTFGNEAVDAIRESKGTALAVGDKEIADAVVELKKHKVYAELGGGTGYAGFLKYAKCNPMKSKKSVVLVTGNN